ncbi:MAG: GAF domain-containing protein, partial [Anaerolineales bacterium]|nr:GAF domain-containing protein [Anaerolineales bacterium]
NKKGEPIVMIGTIQDITERKQSATALQKSEEELKSIFRAAPIGIGVAVNRYLKAGNERLCKMLGYAWDELKDQSARILYPSDKEYTFVGEEKYRQIAEKGTGTVETKWVHKDGSIIQVLLSSTPIDASDTSKGITFTALDITERKQAQEKLQARSSEIESLFTIATTLRSAKSSDEMLPLILNEMSRVLDSDADAVIILGTDQKNSTIALADGLLEKSTGYVIRDNQGNYRTVLESQYPIIAEDSLSNPDPHWPSNEEVQKLGPELIAPLLSDNEILGAICAYRKKGRPNFTSNDVRLLSALGEMVGNALRKTQLYDQALERLTRIQALRNIDLAITASIDPRVTLDILLGEIVSQLKIDAADVLLFSQRTLMLEFTAGYGIKSENRKPLRFGDGIAGRIASERRTLQIPDLSQARSMLAPQELQTSREFTTYCGTPMVVKGQIIGVLETFHRQILNITPEWIEFLEAVAIQAAIAIDNSKLFEDLQRANIELSMAYDATIEGWSRALDLREHESERHSDRVTQMTLNLAQAMYIEPAELVHFRRGALLHDIGKMGIPDHILLKPDKLTEEEWDIMRQHPVLARDLLSSISYLKPALTIPYCHHEKWDGTGYPRGLKKDQIPLAARIFTVADVYDALTSDRPYRSAWSKEKSIDYIRTQSGKHFDPEVVELFLKLNLPTLTMSD